MINFQQNIKLRVPIITFIMGSLFVVVYTFIDHIIFEKQMLKISSNDSLKKIYEREDYFNNQLQNTKDILLAIRKNTIFKDYLTEPISNKKNLEFLFQNIIDSNKYMMQIRFLDNQGFERIRFDRDLKKNKVFQIYNLQDKSSRYYFQDNITTEEKTWFSKLDLNIENNAIEIPYKPTFRVALPVSIDGDFKGLIILNYFAQPLLDKLFYTPIYDVILADSNGYILYHYNHEKDWSEFQKEPFKLENEYLDAISKGFVQSKGFVLKRLELPLQNELYLVLKPASISEIQRNKIYTKRAAVVISIFMFISLLLSVLLFFLLRKFENNEIEIELLTKQKKEQKSILIQKSKMASMGEMIANIAHQWRQPLSVISLNTVNLEIKLQNNKISEEFLKSYIENVNNTIADMNQTIEDFSNFFKPNKEKTEFKIEALISEALNVIKKSIIDNDIEIIFDYSDEYLYLGYKNELLQVLLNIINNSKDAIQINNIKNGKIIIEIKNSKNDYIITIQDNGGGIPTNIIERIFEPYFTTKFKDNGTGIGLYMCKMIIEDSLRGSIILVNIQNGAKCTITLPKGKNIDT